MTSPKTPIPSPPQEGQHSPEPVDWCSESVAGEEDPGASIEATVDSAAPSPPEGTSRDKQRPGAPSDPPASAAGEGATQPRAGS